MYGQQAVNGNVVAGVRIERIGDATLYLGDCLEILPTLDKVDAVVTDVPYGISQEHSGLREINYGDWDISKVAFSALNVLPDFDTLIAWCAAEQLSHILELYSDCSRRELVWIKPNPSVMNGQHVFLSSLERAAYAKNKGAWFGGNCEKSYWKGVTDSGMWREHPTQKPVGLMEWCVSNVCRPNGITLDPFAGSGTTGVACANLGRKFIGIEIEEKYFDIACERITAAQAQLRLFA